MNEKVYNDISQAIRQSGLDANCADFLINRIQCDNYRGLQISQHNRYCCDDVIIILEELFSFANNGMMQIRDTDISKRPQNIPGEEIYAQYVNAVAKRMGRCTQDSIRKNIFVDLHRMGLIIRFDKSRNPIDPYKHHNVKYVSISELGKSLITAKDIFTRHCIYSKCIDILSNGLADDLLHLSQMCDNKSQFTFTVFEFMFFISAIGQVFNGRQYSLSQISEFICNFRSLSKYQKEYIVNSIQRYCQPENFEGDKKCKRDFGNWKNEAQQIFTLMSQTVYFDFESNDNILSIRIGNNGMYGDKRKLSRSLQQKSKYFEKHSVAKRYGFELHHIVPLCWASDRNEFKILDDWRNMIYIDGYKHSVISQTGNKNVKIEFDCDNNIILKSISPNVRDLMCKYKEQADYSVRQQSNIVNYNRDLLRL